MRILPRSLPLALQLVCVLVGLVLGTTIALAVVAYRSSVASLDANAQTTVRTAAKNRAEMIGRVLAQRHRNAEGLLASARSLCGEPMRGGRFGWAIECVQPILQELRTSERAIGVEFLYRGRVLARAGGPVSHAGVRPGRVTRVLPSVGRPELYQMRASADDVSLVADFGFEEITSLFEDRSDLGTGGDVFLMDADGRFLTLPRYSDTWDQTQVAPNEPVGECLQGAGDVMQADYRGVMTFHAFSPVPALGAACVAAHIPVEATRAPAVSLQADLFGRGLALAAVGALLSLLAAHWIARPVRRLALSAGSLRDGKFDQPILIAGPSEVRQLARAFRAMRDELASVLAREQAARAEAQSANVSKDRFLAMVSHELRTPLSAILGWVGLLKQGKLDREGTDRALESIERGAEAQRRLIEDLLDVTRSISGHLRMAALTLPFGSVVEAAVEGIRLDAGGKGITIKEDIDVSVLVKGDPERLQQVVANLMGNAVKFTPAGGTVTVTLRRAGTNAQLVVRDTGPGISPELLPHVFDWFHQGDSSTSRRHSGLGIGLGIVRQLVQLHAGEVHVESPGTDQGAVFTVTLPLVQGAAANGGARAMDAPRAAPALSGLSALRVLVVEDDRDILHMVRAVLEDAGAKVQIAGSAQEAREALVTARPNVIISDIAMPEEDGLSLLRSLRASNVDVPAIALTALTRHEDEEQAKAAGFQVHLPKPVDAAHLIETVARLVTTDAAA